MNLHEFHLYERLVDWDFAAPLVCTNCNTAFCAEWDENTLEVTSFWCPGCGESIKPGLNTLNRMQGVINEFNEAKPK